MLHVRKVIAKACYTSVGHPLRNGMECGMPHVRAGSVAEDKHMARVGRPNQQGGDFSLFRRGKDFHLFCFVSHLGVSSEKGRANWQFALIPSCGLSGNSGKLPVCPTLAPRFSFILGAATGMKAPAENAPRRRQIYSSCDNNVTNKFGAYVARFDHFRASQRDMKTPKYCLLARLGASFLPLWRSSRL